MLELQFGTNFTPVKMDWRLQGASLASAAILTSLPAFLGVAYGGNQAVFDSSWTFIVSEMQYAVIVSLILIYLGIVWRGMIGRASAWVQMLISFGLGAWMVWNLLGLSYVQASFDAVCCRQPSPIVASAQSLLAIGLLVPTLSFASSLGWLFWDGRRRLQTEVGLSSQRIRRRQFEEAGQSLVSAIVTPLMLVFGVWLFFESSFAILQIFAAGLIALSIVVIVLEISLKKTKSLPESS